MTELEYDWRLNEDDDRANVVVLGKDGNVYHADDRNQNFGEIVRRLKNKTYGERFLSLFSLESQLKDALESLGDRVSVGYGQVYLDGDPVDSVISQHIISSYESGTNDWQYLVNFWENLESNPSHDAKEAIMDWLRSANFTLTLDGMIVGYKGLNANFTSIHSGPGRVTKSGETTATDYEDDHLPNDVGNIVEIPRADVDSNRNAYCSSGLHVGTWDYAKNFANGAVVCVHVNPRDVVMVPPDCSGQKMRVCRYKVVRQVENQYGKPVLTDDDWND